LHEGTNERGEGKEKEYRGGKALLPFPRKKPLAIVISFYRSYKGKDGEKKRLLTNGMGKSFLPPEGGRSLSRKTGMRLPFPRSRGKEEHLGKGKEGGKEGGRKEGIISFFFCKGYKLGLSFFSS